MNDRVSLAPLAVAHGLRQRRTTAEECILSALRRIEESDADVKAWVSVNASGALAEARRQDTVDGAPSPLQGISIGVKDVIDIAGEVTRGGSATRAASGPATEDAWIIKRLRECGAIILGKTTTTEYATMDPCATRNPWQLQHTPGGSSSGSAAAVAAGMVSASLGTQTAGSLCRPAAYCGIAAFKPSYGLLRTDGLLPLAPSFDTLGVMAPRIADCALLLEALADWPESTLPESARIGMPSRDFFPDADHEALDHLEQTAAMVVQAGYSLERIDTPFAGDAPLQDHRLVMAFEAYRAHAAVYQADRALLSQHIRALLDYGSGIGEEAAATALERIAAWRSATWSGLRQFDAILTLPVPASAPSLTSTGPAHYQIPWTMLRGPLAVLPGRLDRHGLPLACMLAAAPGQDRALLGLGKKIGPLLASIAVRDSIL